ncbi:MAG: hypothetical protein AAGM84_01630 [Pseudomonadota bacterium]
MAEVRIGELTSEVQVTDTDALLHPMVLARIVAAVEAQMEAKDRARADKDAETRIGGAR